MRTSKEYQDNINLLRDEVDAIVAVAEKEERELNDDETKRVDEITDKLIPDLTGRAKSAKKIERERESRAFNRLSAELNEIQTNNGTQLDTSANLNVGRLNPNGRIPKNALNHGTLRAFKGADAQRDAYVSGMFALAVLRQTPAAVTFCQNHGYIQGAMFTGDNSKGGFVVPDEMNNTVIRLREERGVFPRYANRVPMGSDVMQIPRLLNDVTAYWVGESNGTTGTITESEATLGNAELMARKLAALTKVSSELDEDAVIDVGDMIVQSMAYAMADKVDDAAFNGDGTSAYGHVTGLKNALHANAIQDAIAGNNSALTLDLDDFEAVIGKFPQYTGAEPRWYMHSAVYYASAARLMDAAGGNTNMTLANGIPTPMFLGYPVVFTQVMPSTTSTLASTIVAYFGDLRLGATYGTRRSFRTQVLTEKYADQDLIGIKTTERLGILVHEDGSTIRNRPMIALKTAS